jgi:myo-inositol-1(or 4)-monophosphatase
VSDELLALAREVGREAADFVRQSRPTGRVEVAATKSSTTDDVDPIDGTVNFVYGIPAYAVSIAAAIDGTVVAGYVVNVVSGEEWAAVRGEGAWQLDGDRRHRLTAAEPPVLAHLLVGTGFHYVPEIRAEQAAAVARLLPQVRDIRRTGSAALNLCELAAGRLDAFVEQGLNAWDLAAGGLVATEAGLVVQGLDGEPDERLVMAAHPAIAEEYFALVRACGF